MSPVRKRTAAEPAPAAKAADAKKAKTASAAKPAKASSAPQRASQRERKAVSYKEEDLVEAAERPKPGSYVPPRDPKGMKSTAYNCKYPAAPAPVVTSRRSFARVASLHAAGPCVPQRACSTLNAFNV